MGDRAEGAGVAAGNGLQERRERVLRFLVLVVQPKRLTLQRHQHAQGFAQVFHGLRAPGQADDFLVQVVQLVLAAVVLAAHQLAQLLQQLRILAAGLQLELFQEAHRDAAGALDVLAMS